MSRALPVNTSANPQYDSMTRLRTCEPHTTFDSCFQTTQQTSRWAESTSGGGSVVYVAPAVELRSNGTVSNSVWQTRRYHARQPGKSQLVIIEGAFFTTTPGSGSASSMGYVDATNGYFMSYNGTFATFQITQRAYGVDTAIGRASWNRLPSADFTMEPTGRHVIYIEYGGIDTVTVGVIRDRLMIPLHIFSYSNQAGASAPPLSRVSLPVRYTITNTTGVDVTPRTMIAFGATVISEGGYQPVGGVFGVGTAEKSPATSTISSGQTALIAIRAVTARPRVSLNLMRISVSVDGNIDALFRIVRLIAPTDANLTAIYGGALTWFAVASTDCATEVSFTNPTSAISYPLGTYPQQTVQTLVAAKQSSVIDQQAQILTTASVTGVTDVIMITGESLNGGSVNCNVALQWQELE